METSSSDYDVIVVAQSDIPFIERQGKAILALKGRSFPVDLIVYTPEELLAAGKVPGTAAYWALLEGRSYA